MDRQVRIGGAAIDISDHGRRIDLYAGPARPGQFITLKLAGFES